MNLRTIPYLAEKFGVPVGISDHTMGISVPVAAVALGACLIEKHFTLSRAAGGPDSCFSLEPDEFSAMVEAVRTAESAIGVVCFTADEKEARMRGFRRSIFITEDVKAGNPLSTSNIRIIRPGYGLPPLYYDQVLGRRVNKDVKRGTPLTWDLLD
jgi:N-acetylneuraminate synthase